MEGRAGEEVGELEPDLAGERGFCAGAEDEEADWGCLGSEAFDVDTASGSRWMEGIAEGWE